MQRKIARNLARAMFNAMHWAAIPQATQFRIGAIEGLANALEEAFPEEETKPQLVHWDEKEGAWFFWNETWSDHLGPFKSKKEAEQGCAEYANTL